MCTETPSIMHFSILLLCAIISSIVKDSCKRKPLNLGWTFRYIMTAYVVLTKPLKKCTESMNTYYSSCSFSLVLSCKSVSNIIISVCKRARPLILPSLIVVLKNSFILCRAVSFASIRQQFPQVRSISSSMTQQVSEELSVTEDLRVNGTMYGIRGSTHNRGHFVVTVVLLCVSGTSKAIGLQIQTLKGLNIYSTMQHTEELQSPKKAAFDLSTTPKCFLPHCPISEWSQFLHRILYSISVHRKTTLSVWPELLCGHPVKLDMILIRQMQRFWTVVDIYMFTSNHGREIHYVNGQLCIFTSKVALRVMVQTKE